MDNFGSIIDEPSAPAPALANRSLLVTDDIYPPFVSLPCAVHVSALLIGVLVSDTHFMITYTKILQYCRWIVQFTTVITMNLSLPHLSLVRLLLLLEGVLQTSLGIQWQPDCLAVGGAIL
jgi:hypothetical protein